MCVCRESEGDGNTGVVDGGGVVGISTGHVGGRRGSGIMSNAADVHGMKGVGGVCCFRLPRPMEGKEVTQTFSSDSNV